MTRLEYFQEKIRRFYENTDNVEMIQENYGEYLKLLQTDEETERKDFLTRIVMEHMVGELDAFDEQEDEFVRLYAKMDEAKDDEAKEHIQKALDETHGNYFETEREVARCMSVLEWLNPPKEDVVS